MKNNGIWGKKINEPQRITVSKPIYIGIQSAVVFATSFFQREQLAPTA